MGDLIELALYLMVAVLLIVSIGWIAGAAIARIFGPIDAGNLPTIRSVKQCRSEKDEHETFPHDFVSRDDRINK